MKQLLHLALSMMHLIFHFVVKQHKLYVTMRTMYGLQEMHSAAFDVSLLTI